MCLDASFVFRFAIRCHAFVEQIVVGHGTYRKTGRRLASNTHREASKVGQNRGEEERRKEERR
jgi:hypothetical protein